MESQSNYHQYSLSFQNHAFWSFRIYSKRSFYAYLYGSFAADMSWKDYFNCYLMGGEI